MPGSLPSLRLLPCRPGLRSQRKPTILIEVLPDLIISDLRMPGMSGFELLSIVRRRFPHIPTIAISGEYLLSGMPLGLLVDDFFHEGGYTAEQLLAKIKEFISDSLIRPHLGKTTKAPLWIPKGDAEYIVITCLSACALLQFQMTALLESCARSNASPVAARFVMCSIRKLTRCSTIRRIVPVLWTFEV